MPWRGVWWSFIWAFYSPKNLKSGYFWPSIFKDCVDVVKRCHSCHVFTCDMRSKPALLHPIITVSPFTKWGLDFMDCNPTSTGGHHHIIVAVDYFMKWAEAMPTVKSDGETATHFVFNQIITRFEIPKGLSLTMACTFITV